MHPIKPTASLSLTDLPRHTRVLHHGHPVRVVGRHLNPNRKPGLGRVSYDIERALVLASGEETWGTFAIECVPAISLTLPTK